MTFDRVRFDKAIATTVKKKTVKSRWPLVNLGDVAEISSGGTPSTTVKEYWDGGIAWVTLVDSKQKYLTSTKRTISMAGLENSSAKLLPVNTVIFSSRATIGDVTIAKIETCTNQGYKNFVCNPDKINYEYLYYALLHSKPDIEALAGGMTYKEISKEQIAAFKIPLPPLETQQQLAKECAKIDKAVSDALNKIETANESITNKVRDVLSQQKDSKRLADIVTIISGGTPNTSIPEYWDGDIPWLTVADFCKSRRYVYKADKSISSKGLENSNTRYLQTGDLIISARGTVGAIAQLAVPMTFNQSCYGLRGIDGVDNGFLLYALRHEIAQLKDHAYGSTFSSITIKTFDNILIPLPALADQQRLVADIESLEKKVTAAQKTIDTAASVKAGIMQKYLM
jgi:type I restriction enzyme M protein